MYKDQIYFLLKLAGVFIVALFVMICVEIFLPQRFPGTEVHISKNQSLSDIAGTLLKRRVVTSPLIFKIIAVSFYGQKSIVAGDYLFDKPQSLWTVVNRLAKGDQGLTALKVTIPEGSTVKDIAWLILQKIPNFNAPYFLEIAQDSEGYLFPDTYLFYPNVTPTEVLAILRKNFDMKFQTVVLDVSLSLRKASDIVTMASILEKETASSTERGIISGILWKRFDEGMPLQVDVPIVYITGHNFVTLDDLKIDSPYNTYKYKGLPKGPIANPGLDALRAASHPVKTPYYYYLSDKKGIMHYASTHDGHIANREKYLK